MKSWSASMECRRALTRSACRAAPLGRAPVDSAEASLNSVFRWLATFCMVATTVDRSVQLPTSFTAVTTTLRLDALLLSRLLTCAASSLAEGPAAVEEIDPAPGAVAVPGTGPGAAGALGGV